MAVCVFYVFISKRLFSDILYQKTIYLSLVIVTGRSAFAAQHPVEHLVM